jgi:glyoxylase-like metal-dependent hydrolase (beta-lactamase superfamily II)
MPDRSRQAAPDTEKARRSRWLVALLLSITCVSASAAPTCPPAEQVAPGVFLLPGADAEPSPANGGKVANRVFLVGPTGVVVIDPGASLAAARETDCAIARESALPVAAVINTHPHPENVLANAAYPGLPIYAHAHAAKAMAERCADCRRRLQERIGHADDKDAAPLLPNQPITLRRTIAPGGRTLTLIPLGPAHSPGDLAVVDADTGVLVAGDLVNADRLPDLHDGSLASALAGLRQLQAEPGIRRVIPGRGPPADPAQLAGLLSYLEALQAYARQRVDNPDGFVPPTAVPHELQGFSPDAARQLLNLQHALREAEANWWQERKP